MTEDEQPSKSDESQPPAGQVDFESGETKLVRGPKEIGELSLAFIERAAKSSYIAGLTDHRLPADTAAGIEYTRQLFRQYPDLKLRVIVDLQKENFAYYKELVKAGVELRHMEGNRVSFAISKDEYVATPLAALSEQIASGAPTPREVIWSTRKDVVSQADQIFQMMWHNATRGETRINQLEQGTEPEITLVIDDMERVYELGKKMTEDCSREALMILASDMTVSRNQKLFSWLSERQRRLGFEIRILSPSSDSSPVMDILPNAAWRKLDTSVNVSIMIYDRSRMFITQYADVQADHAEQAVASNIYSTNKATIGGMVSLFEALWGEAELREREKQFRKQAEMLQDILTHDIRNYVQVSKSSAEILREELKGEPFPMLESIVNAADETADLIERTKRLAKILGQDAHPRPVDLIEAIRNSEKLVKEVHREKPIDVRYSLNGLGIAEKPLVLADELLEEIFTNVLSNSVQYTRRERVTIEIELSPSSGSSLEDRHRSPDVSRKGKGAAENWKVTITDHSIGIPDEVKKKGFNRYQNTTSGSGLGLSIVNALVTRYRGELRIGDRVSGDHTQGTKVEVLLPRG